MYVARSVASRLKSAVERAELKVLLGFLVGLAALGCGDDTSVSPPAENAGMGDSGTSGGSSGEAAEAGRGGSSAAGGGGAGTGANEPAAGSGGSPAAGSGSAGTGAIKPDAGSGGTTAAMCAASTLASGDFTKMLMHDGINRRYLVHVPSSYDGKRAVPLVIDIHGYTYSDTDQANVSGWREKSDEEGFIVVHPNGLDKSWNGGSVCCGPSQADGVDDEGFMRAIVSKLRDEACIEPKRVYVTGLSNGAALSYLLACRAADVFAAAAPVSVGNGTDPCNPSRPISMIMFRGTKDELVPYAGDDTYPSAMSDLNQWKMLDSCTGTPRKVNGVCDQYTGCSGGVEVMLCSIPNGMHILYSDAVDAGAAVADVAWEAFKRHALP
jgi:polyhydroxybutyrate depolymerase